MSTVTKTERTPRGSESETETLSLTLHVWRQPGPDAPGSMVRYEAPGISTHMSFLEMLDVVNERLIRAGEDPIAFDHDCREGICGTCGLVINGIAHGPQGATTTCQLHMRHFRDGDTIFIEPWRAGPFPVIKDLVVDRGALDRIIEAGGFVTAPTGSAAEANATLVPKEHADVAFDNAAVHRLRGLRGRLPQCLGHVVHRRQDLASGRPSPRPARAGEAHAGDGGDAGLLGVRRLHQHRRVRGCVPEGDPDGVDRPPEPRIAPRIAQARPFSAHVRFLGITWCHISHQMVLRMAQPIATTLQG